MTTLIDRLTEITYRVAGPDADDIREAIRAVRATEAVQQNKLVALWIGAKCFIDDSHVHPLAENTDFVAAVLAADAELHKQEESP